MKIQITYLDDLGGAIIDIEPCYGVQFLDGEVYATTTDGEEFRISTDQLVEITMED